MKFSGEAPGDPGTGGGASHDEPLNLWLGFRVLGFRVYVPKR